MYNEGIYLTLGILLVLVPLCVPIKLKSPILRRIRSILFIAFFISSFLTLTPDDGVHGAPLHTFGQGKIAFFSCTYQIQLKVANASISPKGICENPNLRASMVYCYDVGHEAVKYLYLDMCSHDYNVLLTREDFDQSMANYLNNSRDLQLVAPGEVMNFPVKLNESEILLFKDSYDQFLGNYDLSVTYGGYLVLYWLFIFVIAGIINWSKIMFPRLHKKMVNSPVSWFRKHITIPATGGINKTNGKPFAKIFDMLVPTRLESIILLGFFLMSAYLLVDNIHYVDGDPVFKQKGKALLRFHAVRASILTSAMMPLLIIFGGRNNILQTATRWDYSSFITFHRWVSRVIMVLVLIHTVFYATYSNDAIRLFKETYIKWGTLGFLSGVIILIQGLLVLRRNYYETFLALHILLAFAFILGAYIHVKGLYCLWFYHITFGVWLLDRLVRIGRLNDFGFPKAKVMLLADEALKVVIPKPSHWEIIPGGHVFIHFLRPSCFWQSHPFTYTASTNPNEIIIFIKVKQGVTESIYNYLKSHPGKTAEIRVAVEGSYGETTAASRYDSAAFIAGGNGIPGIYAEVMDLASRHVRQKLKLIWVVREYRSLYWFYEELLSLRNTKIETTIYVTRPDSHIHLEEFDIRFPHTDAGTVTMSEINDANETTSLKRPVPLYTEPTTATSERIISKIKRELSFIMFQEGRPCMDQIVKETIKESTGSSAFITCGHPIMVDELRASVANNVDNSDRKLVDYFEQLQVWA